MRNTFIIVLSLFLLSVGTVQIQAQNIFSEMELGYKKPLLPYDISYTIPLVGKEFVMLSERKSGTMALARFDEYFFKKWGFNIHFSNDESVPQIFLKGDSIVICTFTSQSNQLRLNCRYFDVDFGAEAPATNYIFDTKGYNGSTSKVLFCDNKSKFVLYQLTDQGAISFQIYETGQESPMEKYSFDKVVLDGDKSMAVHLSDAGELLLAVVNPAKFTLETFYWSGKNDAIKSVSDNFFFERPANRIGKIDIIKQSASSYFVSFSGKIDEQLIGFSTTGVNVILQSVMFSHQENFRTNDIQSVYKNYYTTSFGQSEKHLEVPKVLDEFRFVGSFVNAERDILLMFENLEIPSEFHENVLETSLEWKHKFKKNQIYFGGDLLIYCFSENGELNWKRTIQKTQFSRGDGLATSFIARMDDNQLKLMCAESAGGGSVFVLDINTIDGLLTKITELFSNDKYEFVKRYSCWLTDNAVVVCGVSPGSSIRKLMLVEF